MNREALNDLAVTVNWCPRCDSLNVRVITTKEDNAVRIRRRRCLDCNYSWNTIELSEYDFDRITKKGEFK